MARAGPACGISRGSHSKPQGHGPFLAAGGAIMLFARDEIASKVRQQTSVECAPGTLLKTLKHGVTRYRITLDCYAADYISGRATKSKWIPLESLATLPLSTTGRKVALMAQTGNLTTKARSRMTE